MPRISTILLSLFLVFPASVGASFLEPVDVERESDGIPGLAGVLAVAVSADGRDVYAAAPSDDAIAVFRRDATTGSLLLTSLTRDGVGGVEGLNGAASVALSPQGEHVYAASNESNAVTVFRRDAGSGALTYLEKHEQDTYGIDGLTYARAVTVAPDGEHVYVAGQSDGAIVVFARNGLTGTLRFVGTVRDDVDGVDGLAGVLSLAVSPDGRHVYAAGMNDGAVAVFRRDRSSGTLSFVEARRDDQESLGIAGIHAVAVSPDGSNLYATGQADDAVAVFARDARSGKLTLVEVEAEDVDGVRGLFGALAVTVSGDGAHVYVTGSLGNSIAIFRRDAKSGALEFVGVEDPSTGIQTMACARAVVTSPDGASVYVGGASSNAVTAFRVLGQ